MNLLTKSLIDSMTFAERESLFSFNSKDFKSLKIKWCGISSNDGRKPFFFDRSIGQTNSEPSWTQLLWTGWGQIPYWTMKFAPRVTLFCFSFSIFKSSFSTFCWSKMFDIIFLNLDNFTSSSSLASPWIDSSELRKSTRSVSLSKSSSLS